MSTGDGGVPGGTGQLTVYLEGRVEHAFSLSMPLLTIGRTPDNGLPLPDSSVSARHAELHQTPEGTVLTDVGSRHGTFVGRTRIAAHQPYLLPHGTIFSIGPYALLYQVAGHAQEAEDPGEEAATTPAAGAAPDAGAVPEIVLPVREVSEAEVAAPSEAERGAAPPPNLPPPPPPREAQPLPTPPGPLSSYLRDLPVIFHEHDFLGRYLMIFETLWEPLEQRQDNLHLYFDPATCPATFLPWLAGWLDQALEAQWPEARLRAVLSNAMVLFRWRGTRYGIERLVELCTGLTPTIADDPERPFSFRVRLELPPATSIDRRLIDGLIQAQKPAHAGYVLDLAHVRD